MPDDERRVAHHVVEDAAALQAALPEPRAVRPTVLLGGTGEVGPPGVRRAPGPDERLARLDLWREELVLEVSRGDTEAPNELDHLLRFGNVAGERLLAGDPFELALPGLHRADDLLDVLDPRVVRPAEPDRVDRRVGDHVGDGRVCLRLADVVLSRQLGGRRRVLSVRTPDSADVRGAHGLKSLDVKPGVEPAADETDAEGGGRHERNGDEGRS